MDESLIRGLIIGSMFLLLGAGVSLVWGLLRSPSERARRVRKLLLIGLGAALVVGFVSGSSTDRALLIGCAGLAAAIVGVFWALRGPTKRR